MSIEQLRTNVTSEENDLIVSFAKDVTTDCKHVVDTEQWGLITRRYFGDLIFGFSIFMMLFLIASVIAIAFYTVT